jgi:hypothetical protein
VGEGLGGGAGSFFFLQLYSARKNEQDKKIFLQIITGIAGTLFYQQ